MPRYQITGIGRETNRKRVRVYEANNQEDAFEKASKDGTIVDVDATKVLPDLPPTEGQLYHAKQLGINCPKGITKSELSSLIDEANKRATPRQLRLASELRLKPPPNLTKEEMSNFLDEAMQNKKIQKRYEQLLPTEAQLTLAEEKGIRIPRRITRQNLSALIDEAIEKEYEELDSYEVEDY